MPSNSVEKGLILSKLVSEFLPTELTYEEQAAVEENAVFLGVSRIQMMENAGSAVARFVLSSLGASGKNVVVLCGLGNKGGDGFVAARHLASSGAKVDLILAGSPSMIKSDEARQNWKTLTNMSINLDLKILFERLEWPELDKNLQRSSLILDALLGTGIQGKLREPYHTLVNKMNSVGVPVVAIDVPSGLNSQNPSKTDVTVEADYTVTFHKPKVGFSRNQDKTGEIVVADIGIPPEAEILVGPGDVRLVVKPRTTFSNKWDYGAILIVGGCKTYSGAPALAALSALRIGAGLVVVACPSLVADVVRSFSPSIIARPFEGEFLDSSHIEELKTLLGKTDCVIVGPGIGVANETADALPIFLDEVAKRGIPCVIDAEAIKCISKNLRVLSRGQFVVTPHSGEFETLTGVRAPETWDERIPITVEFAKSQNCTVLLKGHDTIVTDGKRLKVDLSGTPVLATAGSGDVLSGIIGTFISWGSDPFRASSAAAHVLGMSGRIVQREKGFHGVATDFVEVIPEVLVRYDRMIA
jgi:NAD(P)H-hydrate epimerase